MQLKIGDFVKIKNLKEELMPSVHKFIGKVYKIENIIDDVEYNVTKNDKIYLLQNSFIPNTKKHLFWEKKFLEFVPRKNDKIEFIL